MEQARGRNVEGYSAAPCDRYRRRHDNRPCDLSGDCIRRASRRGGIRHDEVPPALLANGTPPAWIDEYRKQAEDAAKSAVARFDAAAKRAGILEQAGWLPASFTNQLSALGGTDSIAFGDEAQTQ
jgi:hypothetical protein